MNMDERIRRINELYHKSQAEGLSEQEKEEQARLRREYVESVRGNLKAQLDSIRIERPDGTVEDLAVRQAKKKLRGELLKKRDALGASEREEAVRLLTERILNHPWFDRSHTVLGFASYGGEIGTDGLLAEILRLGKALYLPVVEGEDMVFRRVRDLSELREGYQGIREPSQDAERFVCGQADSDSRDPETGVLMLVPGVAFDETGARMGYGKGFYDRYLADRLDLRLRTIGVGYACQLVEHVPADEGDIRLAQIVCV